MGGDFIMGVAAGLASDNAETEMALRKARAWDILARECTTRKRVLLLFERGKAEEGGISATVWAHAPLDPAALLEAVLKMGEDDERTS